METHNNGSKKMHERIQAFIESSVELGEGGEEVSKEEDEEEIPALRLVGTNKTAGWKIKIPDIEIAFHSSNLKHAHKKFEEVLEYIKEVFPEPKQKKRGRNP